MGLIDLVASTSHANVTVLLFRLSDLLTFKQKPLFRLYHSFSLLLKHRNSVQFRNIIQSYTRASEIPLASSISRYSVPVGKTFFGTEFPHTGAHAFLLTHRCCDETESLLVPTEARVHFSAPGTPPAPPALAPQQTSSLLLPTPPTLPPKIWKRPVTPYAVTVLLPEYSISDRLCGPFTIHATCLVQ